MVNTHEILTQKCEENDLIKPVEFSKRDKAFKFGRFLTHKGINTEFFYAVDDHRFVLYENAHPSEPYHVWNFEPGTVIIDAVYFPINDYTKGVAVAVWDPTYDPATKANYIVLISLRNKQIVKKIQMMAEIRILCTVYDGAEMPLAKPSLQKSFHENWPHILLVGCHNGLACLTHFGVDSDDVDENSHVPTKPRKCINLSRLFTSDGDGSFTFKSDDNQVKSMRQSAAFVTGLFYIEKAHLVVVGFNFGGIMLVCLVNQKVQCVFFKDGSIEHFALQEPENDPRPILWFWCSVCDNITKQYAVVLVSIMFPQDEAKSKNEADWTYENPFLQPVLKWFPENCTKLLSLKTIFLSRGQISDDRPTDLNESAVSNTSFMSTSNSAFDTSLMLMTWIQTRKSNSKATLHGALFDLNMFYYKRLYPRMVPDNTIAHQYPFLGRFTSKDDLNVDPIEIMDVIVQPQSFNRFFIPTMPTDAFDQLYYPSTFGYEAKVLSRRSLSHIKVPALQDQVLKHVGQNLVYYYLDPREASEWLCALALTNRIPNGTIQEERVCILKALLHNAYHHSISLLLVDDEENLAEEDRKFIVKWLWKEIENAKIKLDEFSKPLFSDSNGLSTSASRFVRNMEPLFLRVDAILTYLTDHCIPETDADRDWLNLIQVKLTAIRSLIFYAKMLNFSRAYKLLPENETVREINRKIRQNFVERKKAALDFGHPALEVVKLVQEMMSANTYDEIWQEKSAENWYPPSYKTLLGILLLVNISCYAKTALVGYYFQDFDQTALWTMGSKTMWHNFLEASVKQENFVEYRYKIERLWSDDDKASKNLLRRLVVPMQTVIEKKLPTRPEDMQQCSLITKEDILKAMEAFLNFEYGAHEWNKFVIARKRFDLIVEMPPPPMDRREPEDIVQCRIDVDRIRRKLPFLFLKVDPLPQEFIEKFRMVKSEEEANVTVRRKPKPAISIRIRPYEGDAAQTTSRKRDTLTDDDEFELRMATPAKRGCFQVPATPLSVLRVAQPDEAKSPIVSQCPIVRPKYISRIRKVMQSPAVMKSASDTPPAVRFTKFKSPEIVQQTPVQAPPSILKSTTKKPPKRDLDGTPLRLRFEVPATSKPTEPEPLITEETIDVLGVNDSVVPSEESSFSIGSPDVASPADPKLRPTVRHLEHQLEDDVWDEPEVLEEAVVTNEIFEPEQSGEVAESNEVQEITNSNIAEVDEQDPNDSSVWPEDECTAEVVHPTEIDQSQQKITSKASLANEVAEQKEAQLDQAEPEKLEEPHVAVDEILPPVFDDQKEVAEAGSSEVSNKAALSSDTRRWIEEHKIPGVAPKRQAIIAERSMHQDNDLKQFPERPTTLVQPPSVSGDETPKRTPKKGNPLAFQTTPKTRVATPRSTRRLSTTSEPAIPSSPLPSPRRSMRLASMNKLDETALHEEIKVATPKRTPRRTSASEAATKRTPKKAKSQETEEPHPSTPNPTRQQKTSEHGDRSTSQQPLTPRRSARIASAKKEAKK